VSVQLAKSDKSAKAGRRANAFMNAWNSDLVKKQYESQALGYLTSVDGRVRLNEPALANAFRKLVRENGADKDDPSTFAKAQEIAKGRPPSRFPYTAPSYGYVVKWLSELGKTAELECLLQYADEHLKPTWEDGGLFYPRNDNEFDSSGEWSHMDPFTGNGAIAYARLNVGDGQKKMWEHPWTREEIGSRPWLDGLDLALGIDCLRAAWDESNQALVATVRSWSGDKVTAEVTARNLSSGHWAAYMDGDLVELSAVGSSGSLGVPVTVTGKDIDVVFRKI
jgi:hypothetical protein